MPKVTRPSTPYMDAVDELLRRVSDTIPESFTGTVEAVLVGGAAVHVYTQSRASKDLDVRFSHRMVLPRDLVVVYEVAGKKDAVSFDTNYAEAVALLHPDCWDEALDGWTIGKIDVRVIAPLDLAVSKIGRWEGLDETDLQDLAAAGLLEADALEARCKEALNYYIGDTGRVLLNLADALEIVRKCFPGP